VRALILTPTRELADQVAANVHAYAKHTSLRSAVVFGGVDMNPQMAELRRGVEILIATPGRLLDHVQQKTANLGQVQILHLRVQRISPSLWRPQGKQPLREAMADRLPQIVLDRRKRGWMSPYPTYLREQPLLREWLKQVPQHDIVGASPLGKEAARQIIDEVYQAPGQPRLRMALHYGEVQMQRSFGDEPPMIAGGNAILVASRVEPHVLPGQIWATEEFRQVLIERPSLWRTTAVKAADGGDRVNVSKGKSEPDLWVRLYRLEF